MTRDEIYDHLAKVYLGKCTKAEEEKEEKQFNAWLVINIFITVIIFSSAFYGLTAFLTHRNSSLKDNIIYSLHNGLINLSYDFEQDISPVKAFVLSIPPMDAGKYAKFEFSIRAKEGAAPGVVKIVFKNKRNEISSCYIQDVDTKWQKFSVPLEQFQQITDWGSLEDVSFILESWNVDAKKGTVLIDDVLFSS